MDYKDIASVSGKGGLFKIVSPTRSGVILESLDKDNKRFIAGIHNKVSVLDEISIYTSSKKGSEPLKDVMQKIYKEFEDDPGVEGSSPGDELKAFFKHIIPDYDDGRVYVSDMKKMISWYYVLLKEVPELLKNNQEGKEKNLPAPEKEENSEPRK